jgi:hypothetical protein
MIFKSKKSWLFSLITFGTTSLLFATIGIRIYQNQFVKEDLVGVFISILVIPLLFSIYFNTYYTLSKGTLKYKFGPIKGDVLIKDISRIDLNKKLWSGIKPATSMDGMIIYYGKYDDIFISPDNKELFVKKLLELNDRIEVISNKN